MKPRWPRWLVQSIYESHPDALGSLDRRERGHDADCAWPTRPCVCSSTFPTIHPNHPNRTQEKS